MDAVIVTGAAGRAVTAGFRAEDDEVVALGRTAARRFAGRGGIPVYGDA